MFDLTLQWSWSLFILKLQYGRAKNYRKIMSFVIRKQAERSCNYGGDSQIVPSEVAIMEGVHK